MRGEGVKALYTIQKDIINGTPYGRPGWSDGGNISFTDFQASFYFCIITCTLARNLFWKIDDSLNFPDWLHQLTYIIVTNNNDVMSLEQDLNFRYSWCLAHWLTLLIEGCLFCLDITTTFDSNVHC